MLREFYDRIFLFKFLLAIVNGLILGLITRILGSQPYSHSTFLDTIQFADGRSGYCTSPLPQTRQKSKEKVQRPSTIQVIWSWWSVSSKYCVWLEWNVTRVLTIGRQLLTSLHNIRLFWFLVYMLYHLHVIYLPQIDQWLKLILIDFNLISRWDPCV